MRRVHRTLTERLSFHAVYECKECHAEDNLPRSHHLHRGKADRCPKCGTYRVVRLKEPDKIDPMHTGPLNMLERMVGGRLHHCRYCRIQFWDRRRLATELAADAAEQAAIDLEAGAEQAPPTAQPEEAAHTAQAAAPTNDGSDA